MTDTITDFNKVKNMVSISMTPLESKNILNSKLTLQETMELKKYYASLFEKPMLNKKNILKYGLIMMVGLPSSGKTTVSNNLLIHYKNEIIHLNQDEIGKDGCIELLLSHAKNNNNTMQHNSIPASGQ
jgi:predicted AAA+ superfamily ATPase